MATQIRHATVGITTFGPFARRKARRIAEHLEFPAEACVEEEHSGQWPISYQIIYEVYANEAPAKKFVEQARTIGMSGLIRAN